jgi:hypothetical protein
LDERGCKDTRVKDHENIHGIVEMTNSNKRRKIERQMTSQTHMEVAEEDKLGIKWESLSNIPSLPPLQSN